jgi:zinc protease
VVTPIAGQSFEIVDIPREPPPTGPKYVHVPWSSETLPFVTVGFLGPAFDENSKDSAAMEMLAALYFGQTSDLYKQLVVKEQKVDELDVDVPASVDASLFTVIARVKNPATLSTCATGSWRRSRAPARQQSRRSDSKMPSRSTGIHCPGPSTAPSASQRSVGLCAFQALVRHDQQPLSNARLPDRVRLAVIGTEVLHRPVADRRHARLRIACPPASIARLRWTRCRPRRRHQAEALQPPSPAADVPTIVQKSPLPQITFKLLFNVGSAHDPAGKEGLAELTAAMLTRAGSTRMTIDQIDAALYPTAGHSGAAPTRR